jgi:hypothetical protein
MSQQPQYPGSSQYPQMSSLPYAAPDMNTGTPTAVRVMAIIGLVLGSLTFLNHLFGIVMFMGMQKNPFGPQFSHFNVGQSVVFGSFAAWQLVGCTGLLMLKEWARKLTLAYALVYPICSASAALLLVFYVIPVLIEPHNPPNAAIVLGGMRFGAIASMFITAVLPIFMLIYLRKPQIMSRFTV